MAGNLTAKERAIVTLTTTGASIATGSAAAANGTADLDARSGGNAPDDLEAIFELVVQWVTITGITAGTVVGELYLLPLPDGTNLPDVDLTASSSVIQAGAYAGSFVVPKQAVTNTNVRLITGVVPLFPALLRPYLLNRSGQTMTANWSLKAVAAQAQYT